MSPVRKEDDFRRHPIKDWDTYPQDAIDEAIERGEFENNPFQGKPIRIESNPHAPDLDFAFSRLKNAGYKPAWMELDEEIIRCKRDLETWLQLQLAFAEHRETPAPSPPPRRNFVRRLLFGSGPQPEPVEALSKDQLLNRIQAQYLQRAADLDDRIKTFNATLGPQLWHLERMRLTPERALETFQEAASDLIES